MDVSLLTKMCNSRNLGGNLGIHMIWPNGLIFHQPIDFPEIAGESLTIHHHLGFSVV